LLRSIYEGFHNWVLKKFSKVVDRFSEESGYAQVMGTNEPLIRCEVILDVYACEV
jgi:hypothetical protein